MSEEEARRFQDEWLAARPKWPQRHETRVERFVNEAYATLSVTERLDGLRRNLQLNPEQRVERCQALLWDLSIASESDWTDLLRRYRKQRLA